MTQKIKSKGGVQERRKSSLKRLEKQLKSGVKPYSEKGKPIIDIPLKEKDVKRIKKEIETLKSRING